MAGLVEKLVNLVGRAFYSDEHVVVLRALVREKFMKDDEMGNAVNLQTRQVRKIVMELHQDQLICVQVLNDKRLGGSSSMSYWYIDYKYFVDVVQYRLYVMHERLKENEQLEIERQTFQCRDPDCGREYTALEAQLLLMPGQYQFRCGHCGEILNECDNNDRLEKIQNLQRKFKDQMNKQNGMHDGIYELLRRIGDFVREGHALPSNLPSDNRAAGIGGNSVRAANANNPRAKNGAYNAGAAQNGGDDTTSSHGKTNQPYLFPYTSQEQEIIIDIAGNEPIEDDYLSLPQSGKKEQKTETKKSNSAMPEFLQGSSITGHLVANNTQILTPASVQELASREYTDNTNGNMNELQRQELFKKAYLAELERYNEESEVSKKVEVNVDKQGWDAEMHETFEEEELEEVEWEACEMELDEDGSLEVMVQGNKKTLCMINDDDLHQMSDEEFLTFYQNYGPTPIRC
uniref:Uncharacterized protein AlNc14C45G3659 n=1 Tax=Albugo laibachii Nc14 TaxID=890382 RepID=F0WAC9_9STRA|nr:conserved hypothetical protein [Albugo laibachii Nc14]|eukprot:CCA18100.1 conserved hypothetical protein [Albugo laibachii Nc14]